ncbi:NADH-quinone oxidoreductase subunit L [Fulvivirga lutimaris]|uniref:NADH-quinone oxidoreductase subunit L n=1 Tax=Fulvivirga lutimaris TaxID=1819566 RepID=UPI0012BC87BE|nr:NADH-quinone oxidoreductase subunit L [Fulvivirga lutimaris]MTI40580.1 NADH-quinone oxidoreductase subunit L [Fulvivirga lutimaris]
MDSIELLPWAAPTIIGLVIFLLPLLSFLILSISSKSSEVLVSRIACGILLIGTLTSILIAANIGTHTIHTRLKWFEWQDELWTSGIRIDFITGVMLVIINLISFLVHLFSLEYMKGDEGYKRYFAFLGLFTFAMLGIVLSDNLLVIFIFWELVGLSSFLLISHWFNKETAAKAAQKAFITNRIGDIGFIIGLGILWAQYQTFDLSILAGEFSKSVFMGNLWSRPEVVPMLISWPTLVGLGLFLGAVGKSAQFPLQVWLPDAMEGPTPISALIHAATMVAAGVYLLARIFFLLNADALVIIAFIGAITAFMGAIAALTQNDIKKVLAFSTISQLGYMVMGIGVGAYQAATMHLFTHAFFKAGLFLAAGSIIHFLHKANHDSDFDAQDMRNMGGLRKALPITYITFLVCSLSLIGVPFFSGFLTKDAILLEAMEWASYKGFTLYGLIPILGFVTVLLTTIYVSRQLILVFFGSFRGGDIEKVVENSMIIKVVLSILALGSIGFIWSINPFSFDSAWMLNYYFSPKSIYSHAIQVSETVNFHLITVIASVGLIAIGMSYSYRKYYNKPVADNKQVQSSFLHRLSLSNWFLDTIYQKVIVTRLVAVGKYVALFEAKVIDRAVNLLGILVTVFSHIVGWFDRAIVDGVVSITVFTTGRIGVLTKSVQGGKVQQYILAAVIGLLIIIFLLA